MDIRPATWTDLNTCLAIDDAFETEYVWQMDERSDAASIAVNFRRTRLPRPVKVSGVVSRDQVSFNFQSGGNLWVAEVDGAICGYIDATVAEWNQSVVVNNLVIAPAHRHQGIGTRLMRAVLDWARQKKMRVVLLNASTKAHPAISFFQKHGFVVCGFSDRWYLNRDIAMMFALNLR